MGLRIFLDVGAHYGETLDVALDPARPFDRLFAFEPASVCHTLLNRFRDPRLTILPFALGASTGTAILYGAGQLGGSVFAEKRQKVLSQHELRNEVIEVVRASQWFAANIPADADLFIKLNCEGSECDIIADLLDAGLGPRLGGLYIDFDVRKVASQAHRRAEIVGRLDAADIAFVTPDEFAGSATEAVVAWLDRIAPRRPVPFAARARFALRTHAPAYVRLTKLAQALLPRRVYWWLGRRFGRLARARNAG